MNTTMDAPNFRKRQQVALVSAIVFGMALVVALSRWTDAHRPSQPVVPAGTDELYVSPHAARRMSLAFNGLAADWYWMRTLQYVGRKSIGYQGALQLDDLSPLALNQLAPLLEHTTTLDPQFMAAYEYGAVVLPSVDLDAALKLIKKGIAENPQAWRLHHHLGYIYWQRSRFQEASAAYDEGSRIAGAPAWMRVMAAQMEVNGGSREVARNIYRRLYAESDDEQVKRMALRRLLQVDSLDERDAIRRVLTDHRARAGRCAGAWREIAAQMRAARLKIDTTGTPLDPSGAPYHLDPAACDVLLDSRSEIPVK